MINILSSKHYKYLLVPVVLALTACTSKPREVHASIPLVSSNEAKPDQTILPANFSSILSNPSSTQLTHGQYDVTVMPTYVSALGYPCRKLIFSASNVQPKKRIACEITYKENDKLAKSWFLENAIIESDDNIAL
ncbi:hypothetical protein V6255_14135 [Psychromonas arctica]|uniref:Lipoprotein n=1 Tax=Psychromonas arctica TaxID=168275 RepID=A0ABU9HEE1_9GAMM